MALGLISYLKSSSAQVRDHERFSIISANYCSERYLKGKLAQGKLGAIFNGRILQQCKTLRES